MGCVVDVAEILTRSRPKQQAVFIARALLWFFWMVLEELVRRLKDEALFDKTLLRAN